MTKHVVIVGGGFGGLATAQALRRAPVRVTLIDRRNHHLFQPLLYQVATAGLAPSDIAEPIRSVLARQDNAAVRLAEVVGIDRTAKRIELIDKHDAGGPTWLDYDYLVLATGVEHSYFGNDSWAEHAPGLKTIGEALTIRRRILEAFEQAEWVEDADRRRALLTFVVIGAGPTGVELSGAIAEIALSTLRRDFRRVDTREARVLLIEAAPAVLGAFPERLRDSARQQLEELGVEVRTETRVAGVDHAGIVLDSGERVDARTVLWAAGVRGSKLGRTLGVPLDRSGRVPVGHDCSLPDHPEVFVIGDLERFIGPDGEPLPGVAPVASSQGAHVAQCIITDHQGRERSSYRYFDKGSMATIGRSRAVLWSAGLQLGGLVAWLAWVFIHLIFLVTFRNRLLVFLKWAWAWFTYERASRLIWQSELEPSSDEVSAHRSSA